MILNFKHVLVLGLLFRHLFPSVRRDTRRVHQTGRAGNYATDQFPPPYADRTTRHGLLPILITLPIWYDEQSGFLHAVQSRYSTYDDVQVLQLDTMINETNPHSRPHIL